MTSPLDPWFAELDLGESPPPSVEAVASKLAAMLTRLRPASIDRNRSGIRRTRPDWAFGDVSFEVHLAHESDPDCDIYLVIAEDEAMIMWSSAHEHMYLGDADLLALWADEVVDAVAAILRGEYVIEEHWRGDRLTKVRIIDTAGGEEEVLSTTGSLFFWLPSRRPRRVERRMVSFDTHQ